MGVERGGQERKGYRYGRMRKGVTKERGKEKLVYSDLFP